MDEEDKELWKSLNWWQKILFVIIVIVVPLIMFWLFDGFPAMDRQRRCYYGANSVTLGLIFAEFVEKITCEFFVKFSQIPKKFMNICAKKRRF